MKNSPNTLNLKKAVLYARVSSIEQEKEGFSIPAQLKLLNSYAADNGLQIVQEYVDVETANKSGCVEKLAGKPFKWRRGR